MSLNTDPKFGQPEAIASAFGRIFYASGSIVYFSQVLEDVQQAGKCYQSNDPTSEEASDLLDTDGGTIEVEGASRISALEPYRTGILAFGDTGVWFISGIGGVFKATEFSVKKVTSFGSMYNRSIVSAGNIVFYLSDSSIMILQSNEFDVVQAQPLTDNTIRSLVIDIFNGADKVDVWGEYDETENRVWWGNSETNRCLIFDLNTQGFYPQTFSSEPIAAASGSVASGGMRFVNYDFAPLTQTLTYNFPELIGTDFTDLGVSFESYLQSAPETLGQASNAKTVTSIVLHMKKTETTIDDDGNGDYVYDFPSSCIMTARFDGDRSAAGGRWTKPTQMYRLNRRGWLPETLPAPFDTGADVIVVKEKLRGQGNNVRFRFEAEEGKDMQILGYTVDYSMRGRQ